MHVLPSESVRTSYCDEYTQGWLVHNFVQSNTLLLFFFNGKVENMFEIVAG